MRRAGFPLACLLLLTGPALAADVATEVHSPTVEIQFPRGKCQGSGTAVRFRDRIVVLTCHHVIEEATGPVYVHTRTGGRSATWRGHVSFSLPCEEDGGCDLAVIEIEDPAGLHATNVPGHVKLRLGETVYYCGSSGGMHRLVERSVVSAVGYTDTDLPGGVYTITQGSGWHGNSGGGMYVERGGKWVLAGVVCRMNSAHGKMPLLCHAPETVAEFLHWYGVCGNE